MKRHGNNKRAIAASAGATSAPVVVDDPIVIDQDGTIRIEVGRLRPPQNVYDADYAWVLVRRRGIVSLFFGKEAYGASRKLRTRLEVRFPAEPFVRHLWGNSRDFHERMRKYVGDAPDAERDQAKPESMEAEKDHSDWANVDYMAHSGTQACLDFFNLSPSGLAQFAQQKGSRGLLLTPVVRVQTTTDELLRLLDACEKIIPQLGVKVQENRDE